MWYRNHLHSITIFITLMSVEYVHGVREVEIIPRLSNVMLHEYNYITVARDTVICLFASKRMSSEVLVKILLITGGGPFTTSGRG